MPTVACDAGAFAFDGLPVNMAEAGAFAFAGVDAQFTMRVAAAAGALPFTGVAIPLPAVVVSAARGTFAFTGIAITAPGEWTPVVVAAAAGALALTGNSVGVQVPGGVAYAEIVLGRVVSINSGPKPVSTASALYIDITGISPVPQVGWYFLEICRDFSATVPVAPPGSIAPPFPPSTNTTTPPWTPPDTGGSGDGGDATGPIPLAWVVPTLIPFHAA